MNPNGRRYYKLNLKNLEENYPGTGKTTLEFRQHSSTSNFKKVNAWVQFCIRFVHNSTYRPKCALNESDGNLFNLLFDTLIQDIKLKHHFYQRKIEIQNKNDSDDEHLYNSNTRRYEQKLVQDDACCDGCAEGQGCEQRRFH